MPKKKITPLNEEFDFKLFITIAQRNFEWFLLFMFLSVMVWYIIIRYTSPMYESSTIIKVNNENNVTKVLNINSSVYDQSGDLVAGYVELIRSRIIMDRAVRSLPVAVSYYSKGTVLENEMYHSSPFEVEYFVRDSSIFNKRLNIQFTDETSYTLSYLSGSQIEPLIKNFKTNQWAVLKEANIKVRIKDYNRVLKQQSQFKKNSYYFTINSSSATARKFLASLTTYNLNPEAKTIIVKIIEKDPEKAAEIANAVATEFIKYDVDKSREATDRILNFIDTTLMTVNQDLIGSELNLEKFKSANRIMDPTSAITELNSRIHSVEDEIAGHKLDVALLDKVKGLVTIEQPVEDYILSLSGIEKSAEIQQLLLELNALLNQRELSRVSATDQMEIVKLQNQKIEKQKALLLRTIINEKIQFLIS